MTCPHCFILPPPNGTTSIGVCKLCGETRKMFNYIEETTTWQKRIQAAADKAKQVKVT